MDKTNQNDDRRFIFGSLFMIAGKLQTLLDRELAGHQMTSRQWFLSCVIDNLFDSPPTLNEVAAAMGSSHQNVKQVALKLQEKGFLKMTRDSRDARAIRLELTKKSSSFWEARQEQAEKFMENLFEGLSAREVSAMGKGLAKLQKNIGLMETGLDGQTGRSRGSSLRKSRS